MTEHEQLEEILSDFRKAVLVSDWISPTKAAKAEAITKLEEMLREAREGSEGIGKEWLHNILFTLVEVVRGFDADYVEGSHRLRKVTEQEIRKHINEDEIEKAGQLLKTFHDNGALSDALYVDMMTTVSSWKLYQ